ncbi:ankyrin repeat domain-containing protein [Campylobacter jejuni]
MAKEKIVSYKEVQANPMLKWFFYEECSIKDKYYQEWQEYVKKTDLNTMYIIEDPKGKDIYDLHPGQIPTIAYYLFCLHEAYDHEFFEFILQFIKDQTWLNFLLACIDFEIDDEDDHIDLLEKTKKVIKLLVDKGANINAYFYDSDGQYKPLIFRTIPLVIDNKTERANKLELLHFLLELGADPNLKNSEGENLLHSFLLSEEQKFANALIDSGKIKDINEIIEYNKGAINYGESALILAVEECYSSTVKKLIEAGANVNVFDHFGESALNLIENKSETIKKYLLKAGAKSSLELLGSEEKLREFKNEMRDQDEMQEKIRKEYKKQLKENYRAIVEKTPLVFHRDIEVIKA